MPNGTDCTGCDKRLVLTEEVQEHLVNTGALTAPMLLAAKPEYTRFPQRCPECWALYADNHDHFCVVHRGAE